MAQLQQLDVPSVLFMGLCLLVMYASFISVDNEAFVSRWGADGHAGAEESERWGGPLPLQGRPISHSGDCIQNRLRRVLA